jgi:FkbM family methyltransferase
MKIIENIRLLHRANMFRHKEGKGSVAYINSAVKQGQTVIDVGANKAGYLYYLLKQIGSTGKAIAFEPQTSLYRYITHIKELFGWNNLTVEHLVVSDEDGVAILYIPSGKTKNKFQTGATVIDHKLKPEEFTIEGVNSETLDAYCDKKKIRPDFIKIDVEGNELRVLEGAIDMLKECRPKLLVEIDSRHIGEMMVQETFRFMNWIRYKGYFLQGLERIPLHLFSFEKHQNINDPDNYCNNFVFE